MRYLTFFMSMTIVLFTFGNNVKANGLSVEEILLPAEDGPLKKGIHEPLTFNIVNNSGETISAGTDFDVVLTLDGQSFETISMEVLINLDDGESMAHEGWIVVSTDIDAGIQELCAYVDNGDDVGACHSIEVLDYQRDVGIASIVSPEEGDTMGMLGNFDIEFVFRNYSNEEIEEASFFAVIGIGPPGNVQAFSEKEIHIRGATYLDAESEIQLAFRSNNAGEAFSQEGEYDICIQLIVPSEVDNNTNNHTSCVTVDVQDETNSLPEFVVGAEEYKVYPNPASENINFMIDLPYSGDVSIEVYDLTGRSVVNVADGNFGSGEHTFTVDTDQLEKGMYIYNVRSGQRSYDGKIIIE